MPDTYTAWGAILLASFLTLATRLSGPIVMVSLPMSPRVERFLQNLSLAVLAALVASMLARGGLREANRSGWRFWSCCSCASPYGPWARA